MVLHNGSFIGRSSSEHSLNEDEKNIEQDVARGAFADMILDVDRNERFQSALRTIINRRQANGDKTHVVDIGTGSGLLSLAAADAGADQVTAVEMFVPSAATAERTFRSCKFADKIKLITGHSIDVDKNYLERKGNIVVAEVFDSELIGEGALRTLKEAHGTLVEKGANVIPANATVWALPVESACLRRFNQHPQILKSDVTCPAFSDGFDFQMSQLKPGIDFQPLCAPFVVFRFDFEDPDSIHYDEQKIVEFTVDPTAMANISNNMSNQRQQSFQFDCVFLWWDLDMDGSGGNNNLTMAPTWYDSTSSVAYFLPNAPHTVTISETIPLACYHDEFAFRFSLGREFIGTTVACPLHTVTPRSAFYRMNELEQNRADLLDALQKYCEARENVICIGSGSLLGLYAAHSGAKTVVLIEPDQYFWRILSDAVAETSENITSSVIFFKSIDQLDVEKIFGLSSKSIGVLTEPFFSSSILPSDNIRKCLRQFAEIEKKIGASSKSHLMLDCFVRTMRVFAMAVKFEHLWKICASVERALGFDLSLYNKMYQKAIQEADDPIGTFPLWEYSSVATSSPYCAYRVDFEQPSSSSESAFKWTCSKCGGNLEVHDDRSSCDGGLSEIHYGPETNALVFWTDVELNTSFVCDKSLRTSGALFDTTAETTGMVPTWSRSQRQGVYFLSRGTGKIDFLRIFKELIS